MSSIGYVKCLKAIDQPCLTVILPYSSQACNLIKQLSFTSSGAFAPLAAFLGGVIAQECLKGLTRKFVPIRQWYLPDFSELLPTLPVPSTGSPAETEATATQEQESVPAGTMKQAPPSSQSSPVDYVDFIPTSSSRDSRLIICLGRKLVDSIQSQRYCLHYF
jgi:hypothetical protein